jgi:hypothetical protein
MYSTVKRDLWRQIEADHEPSLDLTRLGLERRFRASEQLDLGDHGPRNDNLPAKTPTFLSYGTSWNPFYEMFASFPQVYGMAVGAERLLFSEEPAFVPPSLEAAGALTLRAMRTGELPLLVHSREEMIGPASHEPFDPARLAAAPAALRLGAEVESYRPRELRMRVDCPADGWLLVTDRWTRGWRASVDGEEVELRAGNFLFRAVPVHAGENRIRFTYRPLGLPHLVLASWGTLALVAASSLLARRARGASASGAPVVLPRELDQPLGAVRSAAVPAADAQGREHHRQAVPEQPDR